MTGAAPPSAPQSKQGETQRLSHINTASPKPPFVIKTLPNLLFLAFWVILTFFLLKDFLAILSVFPFLPKDFRGSASRRNPCHFGGFPCCFPKKKIRAIAMEIVVFCYAAVVFY